MTIKRTEIVATTWAGTWDMMKRFSYATDQQRSVFQAELYRNWAAKVAAALLAGAAEGRWAEIVTLENIARIDFLGLEKLRMLQPAHSNAVAREEAAQAEAATRTAVDCISLCLGVAA